MVTILPLAPTQQVQAQAGPRPGSPGAAPAAPPARSPDTFTSSQPQARTALQRHVDFFDRNQDRSIAVGETYAGLRALGLGRVSSALASVAINAGLGLKTGSPWHSPLTVNTNNIAAGKHDSDTDIYDEKGNFAPARFEALFANYDKDGDDALSQQEFDTFRNRNKESASGGLASRAEFNLLLKLAGQSRQADGSETKVLTRQQMAEFYQGSLFYTLAGEKAPFTAQ